MFDTRDLKERIEDCFNKDESDVYKTNAHKGYLWELSTLKNHYLSEIGKMLKVLGANLEVANFIDIENFADLTYHHLIQLCVTRIQEVKNSIFENSTMMSIFN